MFKTWFLFLHSLYAQHAKQIPFKKHAYVYINTSLTAWPMFFTLKQVRQTSYLILFRNQAITEKLIVSNKVRGLPHGA